MSTSKSKKTIDLHVDASEQIARLAGNAAGQNLIDVAYCTIDSPFGPMLIAGTGRGLVKLSFQNYDHEAVLEELARAVSPRVMEWPERLDHERRELDQYFEGNRDRFGLRLDWQLTEGFSERVLRATARVGYGATTTYSEVAAEAGSPRAHRAAGNALGANPLPIVVPCHRVLRADGSIGNYGGGPQMKLALLELEGAIE